MELVFRKSRRSGDSGQCVEVADAPGRAFVRDSKDSAGPVLAFTASDWSSFVTGAKRGTFNR